MPRSTRRPPVRRTLRICVRFTEPERRAAERRAYSVGLPVSTYVRAVGLGHPIRARRRHVDQAAVAELGRVLNNVRQLGRVAGRAGAVDVDLARELDATEEALEAAFSALLGTFQR